MYDIPEVRVKCQRLTDVMPYEVKARIGRIPGEALLSPFAVTAHSKDMALAILHQQVCKTATNQTGSSCNEYISLLR